MVSNICADINKNTRSNDVSFNYFKFFNLIEFAIIMMFHNGIVFVCYEESDPLLANHAFDYGRRRLLSATLPGLLPDVSSPPNDPQGSPAGFDCFST